MKRPIKIAVLGAVPILAAAAIGFAFPWIGPELCPTCFGFHAIGDNVFISDNARREDTSRAQQHHNAAKSMVGEFFGQVETTPKVFVCLTENCYRSFEGGSGTTKGASFMDLALFVSPRGDNVTIMAHELAHIELHGRLGIFAAIGVPAWFDEGLAVNVSRDERYIARSKLGDRCIVEPDAAPPRYKRDWYLAAARNTVVYAKAGCKVLRWLQHNGRIECPELGAN